MPGGYRGGKLGEAAAGGLASHAVSGPLKAL